MHVLERFTQLFNGVSLTAGCVGAIHGMFGNKTHLLYILVAFMATDYITGVLIALIGKSKNTKHGHFSSEVCYVGLLKKALILIVLLVAIGVDWVMGGSNILRDATLLFFIANEGLSVLENAVITGLPLPKQLKQTMEKMYTKDDDKEGQ